MMRMPVVRFHAPSTFMYHFVPTTLYAFPVVSFKYIILTAKFVFTGFFGKRNPLTGIRASPQSKWDAAIPQDMQTTKELAAKHSS